MPEINEAFVPYSSKKVVGEGGNSANGYFEPCTNSFEEVESLIVYLKAVRRVGGYLDLDIGDREVRALAMVWGWCRQFKREGGPRSKIVDWSGYSKAWKQRMQAGIGDCLEMGLLDNKVSRQGHILVITEKGYSVFRALTIQSQIIKDEFAGLRQKPTRYSIAS